MIQTDSFVWVLFVFRFQIFTCPETLHNPIYSHFRQEETRQVGDFIKDRMGFHDRPERYFRSEGIAKNPYVNNYTMGEL
jgi:hypothetical protein